MSEIKTCEQYVLGELEQTQAEVEQLREALAAAKKKVEEAEARFPQTGVPTDKRNYKRGVFLEQMVEGTSLETCSWAIEDPATGSAFFFRSDGDMTAEIYILSASLGISKDAALDLADCWDGGYYEDFCRLLDDNNLTMCLYDNDTIRI